MTKEQKNKFILNIMLFNMPTFLLVYLTGLTQGLDSKTALLTALASFLTAFIDLGKKILGE